MVGCCCHRSMAGRTFRRLRLRQWLHSGRCWEPSSEPRLMALSCPPWRAPSVSIFSGFQYEFDPDTWTTAQHMDQKEEVTLTDWALQDV